MKIKIKIETKIENSEVSMEGLGFEEDAGWQNQSDMVAYVDKY